MQNVFHFDIGNALLNCSGFDPWFWPVYTLLSLVLTKQQQALTMDMLALTWGILGTVDPQYPRKCSGGSYTR